MKANVFKFIKMCRECEPFSETYSKLERDPGANSLLGHRFQTAFGFLKSRAEGIQLLGWDSVTVNNAGRLLSFSISLGIPVLSQRTRKFSLNEFK